MIVAFGNQKGGVGKTAISCNLAAGLAERGFRVLILDLDPQGNTTSVLWKPDTGERLARKLLHGGNLYNIAFKSRFDRIDVIPGGTDVSEAMMIFTHAAVEYNRRHETGEDLSQVSHPSETLRGLLRTHEQDAYDFIFIDCPPSLGQLTTNALMAADVAITITTTQYIDAAEKFIETILNVKEINADLVWGGMILNLMRDTRFAAGEAVRLRMDYGSLLYDSIIYSNEIIEKSILGKVKGPLVNYAPKSTSAAQFRALTNEFIERAANNFVISKASFLDGD